MITLKYKNTCFQLFLVVKMHFLAAFLFIAAANAVEFQLVNNEGPPVWVGIQGNPGHTNLNNGGLILNQGQSVRTKYH